MHIHFTILLILQLTWAVCAQGQTKQPEIIQIEFHTLTRGAYENVRITKDSVQIKKKNITDEKERKSARKLKHKEWIDLLNTTKNISLQDIPLLKSPTSDRASDGAYHSTIIITTEDKQSATHAFDNEKPNEKMQLLMLAIRKITKFGNQ